VSGTELAKLRERLNLTRAQAAERLGCSARSIANWEKGETKIPRSIALAVSAFLLNLPPYGKER
jgi:transcriptional regulator with XRE-family HTH domain